MRLCFATNNQHKLNEARAILRDQCEILSLSDIGCNEELPEDHDTLELNAKQKARFIFNKYQINCIADDTGLEVDELAGAPGVYSARYAGLPSDSERNIILLLNNMDGFDNRKARFRTIISCVINEVDYQFEGILQGSILASKRGDHGFGYDSVFLPEGYRETLAEMNAFQKNSISHRGIALKKLVAFLDEFSRSGLGN